jgi:hypothetical protein
MNAKLNIGDTVSYNGIKTTVIVNKKNFQTNQVLYKLEGEMEFISEEELLGEQSEKDTTKEQPTDLAALIAEYEMVVGKACPQNKRKNEEWLTLKIKVAKGEDTDDDTDLTFEMLMEMSREQLEGIIDANELYIYAADYAENDELIQAIAEELEIEIPQA